jgi:hypothetical protein
MRLHRSLIQKLLCKEILMSCRLTYSWAYPLPRGQQSLGTSLTDDFGFRPNIILNSIRNALRDSLVKRPHSLLVLNLGLHYPATINFTTFEKLIGDVIVVLRDHEKGLGSNVTVIWKTTTSIRKENEKPPRNGTPYRFLTEPVRNWFVLH